MKNNFKEIAIISLILNIVAFCLIYHLYQQRIQEVETINKHIEEINKKIGTKILDKSDNISKMIVKEVTKKVILELAKKTKKSYKSEKLSDDFPGFSDDMSKVVKETKSLDDKAVKDEIRATLLEFAKVKTIKEGMIYCFKIYLFGRKYNKGYPITLRIDYKDYANLYLKIIYAAAYCNNDFDKPIDISQCNILKENVVNQFTKQAFYLFKNRKKFKANFSKELINDIQKYKRNSHINYLFEPASFATKGLEKKYKTIILKNYLKKNSNRIKSLNDKEYILLHKWLVELKDFSYNKTPNLRKEVKHKVIKYVKTKYKNTIAKYHKVKEVSSMAPFLRTVRSYALEFADIGLNVSIKEDDLDDFDDMD